MSRTDGLLTPDATLLARLEAAAPGTVAARASDRLAFAHDASHYLLVPDAVITPKDATQVAELLRTSAAHGLSLTFRSGGTSLSGQATNEGVLVDTRRHFRGIEILDDGDRVRVQPGATVRSVNQRLARHGRRLGPDPASESACTIGGVVANNSSGMACGTELNTYRTLESAVLVLPSGTVIDTGAADADDLLRTREPHIHEGLVRLRDRVRGNPASVETIRRLYSIKNTMGYGVNSFVDHTRPVDILTHLVIGSEGTLAFVAEATFRTVPAHPYAATGLLVFPDLATATGALPDLVAAGFATVELLDATSLRVAQRDPGATAALRETQVRDHTALLVEHQEPTAEALRDRVSDTAPVLAALPLTTTGTLTSEPATRAALWHIRKGLYTAVAGARPSGTTALLEDIAVPVDRLLPTCAQLTELFDRHGYTGGVIFGHARHGNIHFLLNEDFDRPELVERYLAFTDDMVDLVLGHGGTLKAEHGTGRIMAPYVRRQYGDELYDVMGEVKHLLDPHGLLNPGVLLSDDPSVHIRHLKSTPTVEEEVDRCVECGYCEPVCPSQDLTTTPRRRIVLHREIARARTAGDTGLLGRLEAESQYDVVDTCAVDGMCRTACPVLIDTGDLTRRLRAERSGRTEQRAWASAARHWDGVTRVAAGALAAARAVPAALPAGATAAGRALLGTDVVPAWSRDLPRGGTRRHPRTAAAARAVYFPACVSTMFGAAESGTGKGVGEAFLALCERAGVEVRVPDRIASLCCGTPWKSKGLTDGHAVMRERVVPELRSATDNGTLPVVVDAASCTEGLTHLLAEEGIRVVDAVAFVDAEVLPGLPAARRIPSLVVHPTCASTQLGLDPALMRVAAAAAEDVIQPEEWRCCAFAGDRGLLHPELTASATAAEARSLRTVHATSYASVNRTCELGMTRATGHPYRHLLELLEEVTRPTPG
ncbi:FAD-binding and (Fe-S)-binding domain-containing protein [Streptomyces caniscabiei]|uniref:FAD-binding and (Fe-S)-binding domain-containing protein n=1 Tax=Streptomyces caniscabiei TaxID=2746961 RepID=UPI0029B37A64|nr:FAD-binding and (Fe-S)-binding domain-containing protein [Streptomyces caniscabiei]MDX2606186.1 FAD-binding and (Fe-S)-binding domain-containing protein [Streptomyces caniscabiei]MDX2741514.1 FAD-binding and (Fe-S)-binding domain-containing protein [Streptomyces caniscabiei]MDX2776860.1 FAD-binding and (Fe-S)-binding domain-containing protein [Streptomyces caniscabiei]